MDGVPVPIVPPGKEKATANNSDLRFPCVVEPDSTPVTTWMGDAKVRKRFVEWGGQYKKTLPIQEKLCKYPQVGKNIGTKLANANWRVSANRHDKVK